MMAISYAPKSQQMTRHAKKQKHMVKSEKQNKSLETGPKLKVIY